MPSTPYDLVPDNQDLRSPLREDHEFYHGIVFQAKFVGWEEVLRPNTRAEIVLAMRRIRYECKIQNVKKRKVSINVSVNGVRVTLKKRRKKNKNWNNDTNEIELLNHPIHRIFYVSHDSSDLKIFSYIARDASTDTFKCSVFKTHKKSQAIRIVRTIGQAFEVCHKVNLHKNSGDYIGERSDASSDLLDGDQLSSEHLLTDDDIITKEPLTTTTPLPDVDFALQRPNQLDLFKQAHIDMYRSPSIFTIDNKLPTSPISPTNEILKLKDQLEQQALQTRQALEQLMIAREQLISETNARIEAQARTQQLLQQNRELLEQLASLATSFSDQQTPQFTPVNAAMTPQQLKLNIMPQSGSSNTKLATINQQINNLGSINQQLSSLSDQLKGLNQQNQNLQNSNVHLQQQHPETPLQQHQKNMNNDNVLSLGLNENPTQQQHHTSKELFQVNRDLLSRLQVLNLGAAVSSTANDATIASPYNSFFFVNPIPYSGSNYTNMASNSTFLTSPQSNCSDFISSPNRTLSSNSNLRNLNGDERCLQIQTKNLNAIEGPLIKQPKCEKQTSSSSGNTDGTAASVPSPSIKENSRSPSILKTPPSQQVKNDKERPETVMLKVTDEAGNVTNHRKLSATPSFITRSTSEKVPNRSQIMSQVQRTMWARHTTK